MRSLLTILSATCFFTCNPAFGQQINDGPTNEKAQKSYKSALQSLHDRKEEWALDDFKKADKQDDGHCLACQKQMIKYGIKYGDWKAAELAAEEIVSEAQGNKETALAHYQYAQVLMAEASQKHKEDLFARAHDEAGKALAAYINFPDALFLDGKAFSNLHQDEQAKAQFSQFLKMASADNPSRQRAQRYLEQPELARARMAPQRRLPVDRAAPWPLRPIETGSRTVPLPHSQAEHWRGPSTNLPLPPRAPPQTAGRPN